MNRIPRRIFSAEFKREAVQLNSKQGLTLAEASRTLDVATKSLRTWLAQFEHGELKASLGAPKLTADQQRIPHPALIPAVLVLRGVRGKSARLESSANWSVSWPLPRWNAIF